MNVIARKLADDLQSIATHMMPNGWAHDKLVEAANMLRQGRGPTQETCRLYQEGWSTTRLAQKYKCSVNTVLSYLRKNGVEIRHIGRPSDATLKLLEERKIAKLSH